MNGSVTQLTDLNNYNSTACKNASFHYLFLCYFTTTAAMFQLCLCYQKWECYGEKCLQTLTFPLLHHAGLLWKTPHYLSLTVLATLQKVAPYGKFADFVASSCQYF